MNSIECETCIKRKTMYCPNSAECFDSENKPYYQNKIMLLEENEQLKVNYKTIDEAMYKLMEENQQLKERINMTKNINRKNKELKERVEQLELILDEIREYIDEFIIYVDEDGEVYFKEEFRTEYNDLLQILDKVKE